MTYEPGTGDIFTTNETPPVEPLTDEEVLADLARRILNNPDGCLFETNYLTGPRLTLDIPRTRLPLSSREYQVIRALAARQGMWFEGEIT